MPTQLTVDPRFAPASFQDFLVDEMQYAQYIPSNCRWKLDFTVSPQGSKERKTKTIEASNFSR